MVSGLDQRHYGRVNVDGNGDTIAGVLRRPPARLARAPISADDADAPARLRLKIEQAEQAQETMKAANRIVRKTVLNNEAKIAELQALGLSYQQAAACLAPDFMGRLGFPDYALKNNNANIRRMKQRLAGLEAARQQAAAAPVEDKIINGATVSENTALNRLQIFFDEKPPADLRAKLKSRGFKWAPSQGAWQRQLNQAARLAAEAVLNS